MLIERLHAVLLARVPDVVRQLGGPLLVFDHVSSDLGTHHDFKRRRATVPVGPWQQPLRHDRMQRFRQTHARDRLLLRREHRDDPAHRRDDVRRMQRGDEEVARLGGLHRGIDGFRITHLADQDHVGILAQRRAQPGAEVVGIHADLALRHRAVDVAVQEFDRVLEREDVPMLVLVDVIDDRRHRRALARAGHTGHEDHPALGVRHFREDGG